MNTLISKVLLFIFFLQPLMYGYLYNDIKMLIISGVNIFMILVFFVLPTLWKVTRTEKSPTVNTHTTYFPSSSATSHEKGNYFQLLGRTIYGFVQHYLFVVSLLLLIWGLIDFFYVQSIVDITIMRTIGGVFFVFFLLVLKDIHHGNIFFGERRILPRDFIFFLSFLFVAYLFNTFNIADSSQKFFTSIFFGWIVYWIVIKMMKLSKFHPLFTLRTFRSYTILFLVSLIVMGISMTQKTSDTPTNFFGPVVDFFVSLSSKIQRPDNVNSGTERTGIVDEIGSGVFFELANVDTTDSGSIDIMTGSELLTGSSTLTGTEHLSGNTTTGMMSVFSGSELTGVIATGELPSQPEKKYATYREVLVYVVKKYNLQLSAGTMPSFTYLSAKDKNYREFVIGYRKRMIGTQTNPSANVPCEKFVVFQGIAQGRQVVYNADTITDAYRAEAKRRDLLPSCKKGEYVESIELKD